MAAPSASTRPRSAGTSPTSRLEDEAVGILREVAAECEHPVLLFSGG